MRSSSAENLTRVKQLIRDLGETEREEILKEFLKADDHYIINLEDKPKQIRQKLDNIPYSLIGKLVQVIGDYISHHEF